MVWIRLTDLNIVLIRAHCVKGIFFKHMNLVCTAKSIVAPWYNRRKKDYRTQKKFFTLIFMPHLSYISFKDKPLRGGASVIII